MGGRWLANLVLLVLVVVLGAAAQRELERDAPRLTALDPAAVTQVRLERPQQAPLVLARADGGWRLEAPEAMPADRARVEGLLEVARAPIRRTLPQGAGGASLGLDPPRVRLTIDGVSLTFGDTEPLAQHRYVTVDGALHLIDDRWWHLLTAPAAHFSGTAPSRTESP